MFCFRSLGCFAALKAEAPQFADKRFRDLSDRDASFRRHAKGRHKPPFCGRMATAPATPQASGEEDRKRAEAGLRAYLRRGRGVVRAFRVSDARSGVANRQPTSLDCHTSKRASGFSGPPPVCQAVTLAGIRWLLPWPQTYSLRCGQCESGRRASGCAVYDATD